MKVSYWRDHKVQPEDYNHIGFGARIEIDTDVDKDFAGLTEREIGEELDKALDEALATAVDRAVALGGKIEESHIIEYYEL